VAAVVSLNGIDEAIRNLDYKAKDSPKLKLVQAIRAHYSDELTPTTLQAIDSDTLVSRVWDTALDENRLRSRRKNLASIRSSVNLDLKLLFENGKNPDGITIGPSNTFVMSDEAKDQMLTSVAASVSKDGPVSLGQITQAISVIEDLLAHTERFSKEQNGDGETGIRRLKQLIKRISERIDLDMGDGSSQGEKQGTSGLALDPGKGHGPNSGEGELHEGGRAGNGKSGFDTRNSERLKIDEETPGGTEGSQRLSGGMGGGQAQAPLEAAEGVVAELGGDTQEAESGVPGSVGGGEGDILTDARADEEDALDETEFIEDPEDFEIVDEPDELEISDEPTAEGLGDSAGGDPVEALDGASQGPGGDEGFGDGSVGDPFGAGQGDSGDPGADQGHPEGIGGEQISSGGSGASQDGAPLEGTENAGVDLGGDGSGVEPGPFGSAGTTGGDLLPGGLSAEEEALDEVEVIDEPEDLVLIDEPDALKVSDGSPVEGLDGTVYGHGSGTDHDAAPLGADLQDSRRDREMEKGRRGQSGQGNGRSGGATRSLGEGGSDGDGIVIEAVEGAPGNDGSGVGFSGTDGETLGPGFEESGDGPGETDSDPIQDTDLSPEEAALVDEEPFEDAEEIMAEEVDVVEDAPGPGDGSGSLGTGTDTLATEGGGDNQVAPENGEGPELSAPGDLDHEGAGSSGPQPSIGQDQGDHPDLEAEADFEAPDLDEVIEEEDDSDLESLDEAGFAKGEGHESGTGWGPGAEPSGGSEGKDHGAIPEMGLPLGSLGLDSFEDQHQTHSPGHQADHKLLAEAFDGYLGAMERFYNQYILIPKGAYTVGGGIGTQGLSERRIRLPEFYMGKFPVTNALFEIFVEKTGYRTTAEKEGYGVVYNARRKKEVDPRTGRERFVWNSAVVSHRVEGACWYQPLGPGSTLHRKRNHPVVQVSLEDAAAFAAWTGKRLPSEAEWEAASRSKKGHLYPWGVYGWMAAAMWRSLRWETRPRWMPIWRPQALTESPTLLEM